MPAPEVAPALSALEATVQGTSDIPTSAEDIWKAEYEANLAEWRARSAEQRETAEAKRAEWEAIRAQEEKEGKTRSQHLSESSASVSGWESVRAATETQSSPGPADVRDSVTSEHHKHGHAVSLSDFHRSALESKS